MPKSLGHCDDLHIKLPHGLVRALDHAASLARCKRAEFVRRVLTDAVGHVEKAPDPVPRDDPKPKGRKASLLELFQSGWSIEQIAKLFDIPQQRVYKILCDEIEEAATQPAHCQSEAA